MFPRLLIRPLLTGLLLSVARLPATEDNGWPLWVRRSDPATGQETGQALGPLFFWRGEPGAQFGLRPVFYSGPLDGGEEGNFLYPFFTWRREREYRSFSFFELINVRRADPTAAGGTDRRLDVWPFYFSRDTGDPAGSYRALFPLAGTIKNRFGHDRITFTAFPLYARTEKAGRTVTHAPWPLLRFIDGDGHHGFEFWPLAGHAARAGDYDRRFWLWPLFYRSATNLAEPVPDVKVGALPFYTRETGPGYISETFVWPLFGYTHRTAPSRYDERRYLWPLLVQARGDNRHVNRWAPVYTHSVIKGYDKTWVLWPLLRHAEWQADGLAQEKDQFLFFVLWSLEQRSLTHPGAAPARKFHFWPLYSSWDNGAGRRQVQALSPFEVFFPDNAHVRRLWSPLFALYRYDRRADGTTRHTLLWDAVTWQRGSQEREFHLGPLLSVQSGPSGKRLALGLGLLGLQHRDDGRGWRLFLFDFPSKAANKVSPP
jgi:hypothetical protein